MLRPRRERGPAACCESVEQVGLLPHDLVVQRLKAEVPGDVRADLRGRELRYLGLDQHGIPRRRREQLRLAGPLHRDEPPRRLVDGVADREQAVVAQDDGLAATEGVRQALALLEAEDAAREAVDQALALGEAAPV